MGSEEENVETKGPLDDEDENGNKVPVSDEDKTLWRVCRTLFKMLDDRGYLVGESEIGMKLRPFLDKYGTDISRKDLVIHKYKKRETTVDIKQEEKVSPSDQIYVFFPVPTGSKTVGIQQLRNCIERMHMGQVSNAIFVVPSSLTSSGKAGLQAVKNRFNIDVFLDAELIVNVSLHKKVPTHALLTKEEQKEVLDKYGVTEAQLPRILASDPVAKYFGAKSGQLMKIIRNSPTAGKYITYRYVV